MLTKKELEKFYLEYKKLKVGRLSDQKIADKFGLSRNQLNYRIRTYKKIKGKK